MDRSGEFVWRGDGEEAEVAVVAPDETSAGRAFERALPAAMLPGAESPVWAAASEEGFGWAVVSSSHAAPDLVSVPERGVLLVAEASVPGLGVPPEEVMGGLRRDGLPELRALRLNAAGVRRVCEIGASAAAEDALIEEEDLRFFSPLPGEADSLGRRAVSAGEREWNEGVGVRLYAVEDVLDSDGADLLGLEAGMVVVEVSAGAGELGRISASLHRERILERVRRGEFDSTEDLPAAPLETEEAHDLLSAARAAANFADGRASLAVFALRRALAETMGGLEVRAAWRVGGAGTVEGGVVHRRRLAAVGEGEAMVSGGEVCGGVGTMYASAPPFDASVEDGRRVWEEAGLIGRWAGLEFLGGEG